MASGGKLSKVRTFIEIDSETKLDSEAKLDSETELVIPAGNTQSILKK